ncbi:helix-turn-helix domain-containing protein [Pseudomonas solani]|uniref:helix-turn-helix domain-containing protein n=1 Tax=Pseudomonas TaxID=286 RepID=UPI000DA96E16|nr:XRE family transcriptional regulator [Pseudomonas sp. 57B-090624]PZE09519.1 XRE family transcriptional regulator [Pseudomonas sp. 57B-090624]
MAIESYANVWDALLDSPEEAKNMQLRSQLMMACAERVRSWNLSQKEAAGKLHITQPRLNDLLNGKISKFSLDALVNLLASAEMEISVSIKPIEHEAICA